MVLPLEQTLSPTPAKDVLVQDYSRYRKAKAVQARFENTQSAQSASLIIKAAEGPAVRPRIKTLITLVVGAAGTLITSVTLHLTGASPNLIVASLIASATLNAAAPVACVVDLRRVRRRNDARQTTREIGEQVRRQARTDFAKKLGAEGTSVDSSLLRMDLDREHKLLILKANALRTRDNRVQIATEDELAAYVNELRDAIDIRTPTWQPAKGDPLALPIPSMRPFGRDSLA